jgi:2-keto-4-pentenoate hydratase
MLTDHQIAEAARFITGHWRNATRCEHLPAHCTPQTRGDAYRIQALLEGESANPLYGWKIAATSAAGQKHIGVDGPLAGRYITERVVASGAAIPFGANHMKVAEIEFAFRLASDIRPRHAPYTEEEVFAAIASLHPAIEIPDSRYDDYAKLGAPQLIADNACAHWLAVGAAMPDNWRKTDLAAYAPIGRVFSKHEVIGHEVIGKGANVLGSPRTAMTWLINELSTHGITARAGQLVTTGTCVPPMPISAGDRVEGDFGELGKVVLMIA